MKQFKYKKWLFVEVPEDGADLIITSGGLLGRALRYSICGYLRHETLPQGQYSIIGKADELTEEQWLDIGGDFPLNSCDACNSLGVWHCAHPEECGQIEICVLLDKEAGYLLLKSHDMKPNQTLVLKLNEAHTGDKVNN